MATTYTGLLAEVADTLNRDDLTSVIPTFVAAAEAQLNRDVRHWKMEAINTSSVNGRYAAIPSDWVETIRATMNDKPLALMSRDDMQRQRSKDSASGMPLNYAHVAGQIELYPTPDAAYDLELLYIQSVPALATNETNWLLTLAPDLYLYAALIESAIYLKDEELLTAYAAMYKSKLEALNSASRKATSSGTNLKLKIRSY